jgi:hypothetical protein
MVMERCKLILLLRLTLLLRYVSAELSENWRIASIINILMLLAWHSGGHVLLLVSVMVPLNRGSGDSASCSWKLDTGRRRCC